MLQNPTPRTANSSELPVQDLQDLRYRQTAVEVGLTAPMHSCLPASTQTCDRIAGENPAAPTDSSAARATEVHFTAAGYFQLKLAVTFFIHNKIQCP